MKMKHLTLAVLGAMGAAALPAQAALNVANEGAGHILIVPYFSTQNGNDTLINLINTDAVNGKAVKVRFRSALDSDDIFDFHVYLSPSDMWAAKISMDADTGKSKMEFSDTSCTRPAKAVLNGAKFVTTRLDPALTDVEKANLTREGYIEILNMADVGPGTVYNTIVHSTTTQTPNCTAATLEAIGTDAALFAELDAPTGTLAANWTIINVPGAAAYSGTAVAITADTPTNVVYFDQNALQDNVGVGTLQDVAIASGAAAIGDVTADGVLLRAGYGWANYDLPDLSTPYEAATLLADDQATALSASILRGAISNEFITLDSVSADTDWVISMPTRRYHVAGRGQATDGVDAATTGFYDPAGATGPTGAFANTSLTAADQVTRYADNGRSSCVRVGGYTYFNREEQSPAAPTVGDVISPDVPVETPNTELCGEVTVVGMNQNGATSSGVLGGQVAYSQLTLEYETGWGTLDMDNGLNVDGGLPVVGQAFVKAFNPTTTSGAATYGVQWQHNFTAP